MDPLKTILTYVVGIGFIAIISAGMTKRYLVEKKFKNLLRDEQSIRRIPPFNNIDMRSVPNNSAGKKFIEYEKFITRRTTPIVLSSVVIIIAAIAAIRAV